MADKARKFTDKELKKMERNISKIYKQAEEELTEKWNAYMEKGEKRLSALQNAYTEALKVGDEEIIEKAEERLQKAKKAYTLQSDHYKAMVDSVTLAMAQVNQKALSFINGELPTIYAENHEQARDVIKNLNMSFTLADKGTVKRMIKDGDIKLPKKKISIPKDQRWNTKKINSAVLQGILQGEPMDKIADRLLPIVNSNEASAIRNARTLVTGAENRGRLDSYEELEEQGLVLKKVWVATGDSRTRQSHLDIDGEEVDIDEEFSNGCKCPGDPDCDDPSEVYNCRCTMRTQVVGFRAEDGKISLVGAEHEEGLHQDQIFYERHRRRKVQ